MVKCDDEGLEKMMIDLMNKLNKQANYYKMLHNFALEDHTKKTSITMFWLIQCKVGENDNG